MLEGGFFLVKKIKRARFFYEKQSLQVRGYFASSTESMN
jgi:hypothetical protein